MQNQRKSLNFKNIFISLFIGFLVVGLLAMPVAAQPGIDQWLAFGSDPEGGLPEVALLSSSAYSIEVQAIMPGARFGETSINGQTYLTLNGEGYSTTNLVGAPALPVLRKLIEIPL